jgi:UDP-N-acetylmuramate--alanine ligase
MHAPLAHGALDGPAAAPLDLTGVRSAYLVGLEGVGMSGAARLLLGRGVHVAGSDRTPGPRCADLAALGVAVTAGEDPAALPAALDLLVVSAAIPPANAQWREAARRGVRVAKYAHLVGALMEGRVAVCVAGCHGKTTTTGLVAAALLATGRDPSFVVGGTLRPLGAGARAGSGAHFVAESCEFDRSFHAHRPTVAVVTNVDEDHLDYYRDLAEIQESFRVFAARLPTHGVLVAHESCAGLFRRDPRLVARLETYGFGSDALWSACEPRLLPDGRGGVAGGVGFDVLRAGERLGRLELPLLGAHNALNGLGALAALVAAGLTFDEARRGLAAFQGVGRRLETVADRGGVLVLDDYGHHPAEIRAVIAALRARFAGRRLVIVFQPHQASRTRCLLADFAAALAGADLVWMPPIYFARDSEEERRRVTSEDLADAIRAAGGRAETLPDLAAVVQHAALNVRPGDVVVTMGAGDVDEAARGLAARLR